MPKRREIVFPVDKYIALRNHLLQNPNVEQMAFIFAGTNQGPESLKLLVHDITMVPPDGLVQQSGTYLEAHPDIVRQQLMRCQNEGLSLIEIHSHPFSDSGVSFSSIDSVYTLQAWPIWHNRAHLTAHSADVAFFFDLNSYPGVDIRDRVSSRDGVENKTAVLGIGACDYQVLSLEDVYCLFALHGRLQKLYPQLRAYSAYVFAYYIYFGSTDVLWTGANDTIEIGLL